MVDWTKIKIGYVGYSHNLSHPADRRRIGIWSAEYPGSINVKNPLDGDILVLSNAANFGKWLRKANQPVLLDLVDGYLGENPTKTIDILRNISRAINRKSDIRWGTYTRHLRYACQKSSGVIVASEEQAELVRPLNSNVFIILDNHDELNSFMKSSDSAPKISEKENRILWEGFGFTLKHFEFISLQLESFLLNSGWELSLITNQSFPRWGGFLGTVKTRKLVKKWFPNSYSRIKIIDWSLYSLSNEASKCKFAIIPLNPSDNFALYKSENKLLSMWVLGLPTITSNSRAYARVLKSINLESALIGPNEWFIQLSQLAKSEHILNINLDRGSNYVQELHTRKHLLNKWKFAFRNVI